MELKNVIVDTRDMSFEEIDALIRNLKAIRSRKGEARSRHQNLCAMVENMREDDFVFCSKYTGEVLNPNDWVVYDNINHSAYPEMEEEE